MRLSVQEKLFQHVDEHIAFYVSAWEHLYAHLNSPDSQKILEAVIAQLQRHTMQVQILSEQMPLIYGELQTGAVQTLLFYHRYDMHTLDLQKLAPIAALFSALEACKKVSGQLSVNIKWLLDGSGEDSLELKESLKEYEEQLRADGYVWHYKREAGFGEDSAPILALGTKGRLRAELEIQTASTSVEVMHGAIVPDALWRLLWALNSLKDAWEEIKIEGFYDTLVPDSDDTITALYALPENAQMLAKHWGLPQLLMDLKGFQLHYAHLLTPTCTVTGITSNSDASISTQAKAEIDFHLVPDQKPEDIFVKLKQHLRTHGFQDIQARMLRANQPTITGLRDPFVQRVIQATEKAYGRVPYVLPTTVGSYPLHPLQEKFCMPIVLVASNEQDGSQKTFAANIKQLALIIEESAHGTDTTH